MVTVASKVLLVHDRIHSQRTYVHSGIERYTLDSHHQWVSNRHPLENTEFE